MNLEELLRHHYRLKATSIRPGPRGFVAETHIVETDGPNYFAKLTPISRYSANIEKALPVQKELHDLGIRQMSYPMPTTSGALSVTLDRDILVVYTFIDGEQTFDYPLEAYVDLLTHVHRARITVPAGRETFEDPTLRLFERQLDQILRGTFVEPSQQEFHREIRLIERELEGDLNRYRRLLGELARIHDAPMVVTHNDAPGNILRDTSGRLYLIDWDDVLLAPPERDTWFHLTTPQAAAAFLPLYQRAFLNYEVDQRFYAFYLYKRYFEDIEGFLGRVLSPDTTAEAKAESLGYFKNGLAWVQEPVRELANA